jgi:hypothetical protein
MKQELPVTWTDGATSSVHLVSDAPPILLDMLRVAWRLHCFKLDPTLLNAAHR